MEANALTTSLAVWQRSSMLAPLGAKRTMRSNCRLPVGSLEAEAIYLDWYVIWAVA